MSLKSSVRVFVSNLPYVIRRIYFSVTSSKLALGKNVKLGAHIKLKTDRNSSGKKALEIGADSELQEGVILETYGGNITLGENTFIGPYSVIYGHGNVTIGRDVLIATGCKIFSSNHDIPSIDECIRSKADLLDHTLIGDDVWLGANTCILAGVAIGNGCVIGAGSVVTKDMPKGAIAYGVPAKVVRFRED